MRILVLLIAAGVLVALGTVWFRPPPARPAAPSPAPPAALLIGRHTEMPAHRDLLPALAAEERARGVVFAAEAIVARVNGRALTTAEILPLTADADKVVLARDEHAARLQSAIDRELTFQAAEAAGVTLSEAQWQRLDQVQGGLRPALYDFPTPQHVRWSSITQAQLDFEARHVAARLLQENLLARNGVRASPTMADVERYYAERRQELAGEAVSEEMDRNIRRKLTGQLRAQYERERERLLATLRAAAQIEVTPLP